MSKILLSYRRSDTAAMAGRIHDYLAAYYGKDTVFMDIDSIPFTVDFHEHIQNEMRKATVMLAIVGPHWLGPKDDGGNRIMDESDPVRIEVEGALQTSVPIMPIMVSGASMPRTAELPESIQKFHRLNAPVVDSGRDFRLHMERVTRTLDQQFGFRSREAQAARTRKLVIAGAAGVVAIAAAAIVGWGGWWRGAPMPASSVSTSTPVPNTDTVVDFSKINTSNKTVAARPYLKDYGISVVDLKPATSNIIIANNSAIYDGAAIRPTLSQNFLMQIETNNVPASYTLRFDRAVDTFKFVRPQLFRDTDSGITHPAWVATALDANGRPLSSQSEALLRSHQVRIGDTSAQTYVLRSPGFEPIAAVRFDSDPTLDGKPFAAFSALVIEQITLVRLKSQ